MFSKLRLHSVFVISVPGHGYSILSWDAIVGDFQFFFSLIPRTAGLPQYGQLGHGTDNEVFSRMMFS